ncbi:28S ribosomal protein S5, mitochondrial-like [Paramacrobiotus metropolitanus]|uniref:28S ribosomal protein S5, mitochondrial-like n=1 Tax=Paramacrobiotus metropolitanus TaxID=2943436 RepID=UPI002445E048|nr:28S ribosomal protein S5, mitochondrial-like [Paramacrobiotus metropolitanus]
MLRALCSAACGVTQRTIYSSTLCLGLPMSSPSGYISARSIGSMSFFNHHTGEQLWKSATSVSNAGKKRGRARGRKMIKNLNRGQVIGLGPINMMWPGLTAPAIRGREMVRVQDLGPSPERRERLYKLRDSIEKFRTLKVDPLERGWSGTRMPGRSIGPPDPIGEESFGQFDCKVLEMKQVANMTGSLGRVRRFSILVVTGNKNGLVATALAKAIDAKNALRKARNSSIRKLRFIERFENRTVYHDFQHQIDSTAVFVKRMPPGTGVVAHRAIRTICDVAGISDLYAKTEGRMNLQKIVKCFLAGVMNQEVYQQLAERKRMHVVEFRPENKNFPIVLASPKNHAVRQDASEIDPDENLRFDEMYNEGKVCKVKPKKEPHYTRYPDWPAILRQMERERNHHQLKVRCWMDKELNPSTLYEDFPAPDQEYVRPAIPKPKERFRIVPSQLKRIGGALHGVVKPRTPNAPPV